jgi:hypothetical protein
MPRVIRKREENIFYEDGKFTVTDKNLKTPRKTYRIARIEKIALRRDPFYLALALAVPLIGFLFAFNNYLYNGERVALVAIPIILIGSTARLGVLFVESRTLGEMAAIAPMTVLREVRSAVEDAIDGYQEHQERDIADD